MSVRQSIETKLAAAFPGASFDVIDESHLHAGHAGARPEGETHFRIKIAAPQFAGMSRIERHRAVMDCLAAELAGPVHALAVVPTVSEG